MPDSSHLAWYALCVLDEAVDRSHAGPVLPTPALRLALAVLAEIDGDLELYHTFWSTVRDAQAGAFSDDVANYQRRTNAEIALIRLCRRHGLERIAPGVSDAMRRAWAR